MSTESSVSPVSAVMPFKISDRQIRFIAYGVGALVLYLIISGKIKKWKAEKQYEQAGTDPNTNLAIAIHQACNPSGIGIMIDFDFTNINDLMDIADQIDNITKVADAYANLYNTSMYERLEKELNAAQYTEWTRRAKLAPTVKAQSGAPVKVKLYAVRDTNVFYTTDSTKIAKKVKTGETIGTVVGAYNITVNGVTKGYYKVSWTDFVFFTQIGLVLANDTKQI